MKIDRLMSIIMVLNNRERVTAKELAQKYEVSVKTIQRDMEAIDRAGIPVVSYQGKDGGYGILKEYKIDRSSLRREDMYLITKLLEGLNHAYEVAEISALKEKFAAISGDAPERDQLHVDFSSWSNQEKTKQKLGTIHQAFLEKKQVVFSYHNLQGQVSHRTAEPVKLIFKGFHWYLAAYCVEKAAMRLFKVKRMRNMAFGAPYLKQRDFPTEELLNDRNDRITNMRFKISKSFLNKIDDYFDEYTCIAEEVIEVSLPLDEWLYSLILGFGSSVEVLQPPELRQEIKKRIIAMSRIYE